MRTLVSPIAQREGEECRRLPFDEWPAVMTRAKLPPFEVWLSRHFLAQLFHEEGADRLSVNRTTLDLSTERWVDGITWEELQRVKTEVGRGDAWAVELYPSDAAVVDVAAMRHLWLLDAPPPFGWNRDVA